MPGKGKPFEKGKPKHPGAGRAKGTPNKLTRDVKEFIDSLTADPEVQDAVRDQILAGRAGALQGFLGFVAHKVGKPKESLEVSTSPDLTALIALALEKKKAGKVEP